MFAGADKQGYSKHTLQYWTVHFISAYTVEIELSLCSYTNKKKYAVHATVALCQTLYFTLGCGRDVCNMSVLKGDVVKIQKERVKRLVLSLIAVQMKYVKLEVLVSMLSYKTTRLIDIKKTERAQSMEKEIQIIYIAY